MNDIRLTVDDLTIEIIENKIKELQDQQEKIGMELDEWQNHFEVIRNKKILEDKILSKMKWEYHANRSNGSLNCLNKDWDSILRPYWKMNYHDRLMVEKGIILISDDSSLRIDTVLDEREMRNWKPRSTIYIDKLLDFIKKQNLTVNFSSFDEIIKNYNSNIKETMELKQYIEKNLK